ncbi:hypothetical protein GQX74_001343 [Glossina fuscipes]|nr:hypothetical protein GQX74_001343 [Glossina fuscipes]
MCRTFIPASLSALMLLQNHEGAGGSCEKQKDKRKKNYWKRLVDGGKPGSLNNDGVVVIARRSWYALGMAFISTSRLKAPLNFKRKSKSKDEVLISKRHNLFSFGFGYI